MVSLRNSKDIIANSLGLISEDAILDVGDNMTYVAQQLETKATKTTVYTNQETYTQQQVNALIGD